MLAYARTAFMLAATGGTLLKLFGGTLSVAVSGWGLVAAAIVVGLVGAVRYQRLSRVMR